MESIGGIGKVNICQTTYDLVKENFKCNYLGEIEAKGKGKMYFVKKNDLKMKKIVQFIFTINF